MAPAHTRLRDVTSARRSLTRAGSPLDTRMLAADCDRRNDGPVFRRNSALR